MARLHQCLPRMVIAQRIEMIGPVLHETDTFGQVFGPVVGGAHAVLGFVGELFLDDVVAPALLVQDRGGHGSEAVPGHLAAVAHAVQGKEHGVVAHGHAGVAAGPDIEAVATGALLFFQDGERLGRQGDEEVALHLHPRGGDEPLGFVEVDLVPGRFDEFFGAHEGQGQELQGALGLGFAALCGVVVDGVQQRGDFVGLDGGLVFLHMRGERTAQAGAGVEGAAPAGNGVAEDLGGDLHDAVGQIVGAAGFHLAQGVEHLHGGDAVYGKRAEVGEEVGPETTFDVPGVRVYPEDLLALEPFEGLVLETVGGVDLGLLAAGFALGAGVDTLQELALGVVALLAGLFEADQGIGTEGDAVLAAVVAVFEPPAFAAGGGDVEVEAAAVKQAGGFLAGSGLGSTHSGVGELGHGSGENRG